MITVTEIIPIKLSGLSSFKVTFNYSEELVNIIKTFSPAIWHKKDMFWEIGANYLHSLLDTLVMYDDIELEMLPPVIQPISENLSDLEISKFKFSPFKHQIEGINFLLNKEKSLLLDSMGVGKSLQVMYLAETLHRRGKIKHCLLICGVDSLRSNWKSEIQKFSNESVIVLGEKITKTGKTTYAPVKERIKQLLQPIDEFFVIINIATLRSDEVISAISSGPNEFGLIITDEIHKASNVQSSQGSNLVKLKAKYKVGATGTPIVNSPLSCYGALKFIEADHSTLTNYKGQYCEFGSGIYQYQVMGYKNLDMLQAELEEISLRRTFSMIKSDMPRKIIEYELVEMSDEHAQFYDAIKTGVKEEADKIELNTNNLLALTTRLRQATSSPSTLTSQPVMSTKVERCVELVEELLEQNEKVVVFCNFIDSAEELAKLLTNYNPILCTGKQTDDYMQRGVDQFRNSTNFNLLVATVAKMGVGFSFPECHYAIFLDQPFTSAQFAQACDRIYRITSKQSVFIKVLLCKDTYDERVKNIVDTKQDLSDYLVDGIENERMTDMLRQSLLDL